MGPTEQAPRPSEEAHVNVSVHIGGAVDDHPLQVLSGLRNGSEIIDGNIRRTVSTARAKGCSWDEIGRSLGISRQSAWERFSDQ